MINFNPVIEDNPNVDLEYPPTMQPLIIKSENEKLLGTFFNASGKDKKPILFLLHGFPGNEVNYDIAHATRRLGINVVVFHYRGTWGSGGSFSISNSLADVSSVLEYFNKVEISDQYNYDINKMILIGHSMGGFLSMLTAMKYPNIKNIASLAGFNFGLFTDYILSHPEFKEITMQGLASGSALVENSSAEIMFEEMVRYKDEWNIVKRVNELREKNILFIVAEYDTVAPFELHHAPLAKSLNAINALFKSETLKCGHSFSSMRIRLTKEIINWLENIKF